MIENIIGEITKEEKSKTDLSRIFQVSDYIQKNIEAYQHLRHRDYVNAKNSYKECVNISKTLVYFPQ